LSAAGRATRAASWTTAAGSATTRATLSTVPLHEVGDELLQFILAELAIFVRIEFHGVSQHAIRTHVHSLATTGTTWASSAGTTAAGTTAFRTAFPTSMIPAAPLTELWS